MCWSIAEGLTIFHERSIWTDSTAIFAVYKQKSAMKKRKRRLKSEFAFFLSSRSFQLAHFVKCKRQLKQSLLELIPSEPNPSSEREKKIVIACSSPLSNVKLGILTSLLARCDGKIEQKKFWTTSAELLFSLFNLLPLLRSRCRCRRGIIGPFYMAGGGGGGGRRDKQHDKIKYNFNLITFKW